ncbi:unnamed protein product, partial [Ectocarpus sp. 8 AP-2014]
DSAKKVRRLGGATCRSGRCRTRRGGAGGRAGLVVACVFSWESRRLATVQERRCSFQPAVLIGWPAGCLMGSAELKCWELMSLPVPLKKTLLLNAYDVGTVIISAAREWQCFCVGFCQGVTHMHRDH